MSDIYPEALAGMSAEDIERRHRRAIEDRLSAAIARAVDGETDWDKLTYMMGRNELADLLCMVWRRLPQDQLIRAVGDAWTGAEFPEDALPRSEWLPIFHKAGYHQDDHATTPPESITLWRGGVRKTRMAWTGDREQAEWFRRRYEHIGKPAKLWTVTAGPDRLLAHYMDHRGEDEYVIDPTGLRPKEVTV